MYSPIINRVRAQIVLLSSLKQSSDLNDLNGNNSKNMRMDKSLADTYFKEYKMTQLDLTPTKVVDPNEHRKHFMKKSPNK